MSSFVILLLSAIIGYLLGAIPFGYILVKLIKDVDLRQFGSGRTGGTNAFRAAGIPAGVVTSILDVLKGACAVWVVRALFSDTASSEWLPWLEVTAGVMSVIGHNWSIFIGWKGGAGTGPNVGWAAAVWFPIAPVAVVVVLAVLVGIGIASIASLAMAFAVPIAFLVLYLAGVEPYNGTLAYIIGGVAGAAVIAWALRPNIAHLLAGNERLVGPRSRREKQRRQSETADTE